MKKQIFSRKPIENGTVFNRLTVIEFSHVGSGKRRFYLCQCKCGNKKTVSGIHLKNKGVQSCGCLRGVNQKRLEIGEKINRLTVIEKSKKDKFLCLCDCGTQKEIRGEDIKNESIKSCGCLRNEKLKKSRKIVNGEKYNKLTVINLVDCNRKGKYYLCRCDCGNEKILRGYSISYGSVKSCGCLVAEKSKERFTLPNNNGTKNRLRRGYKKGAKKRNIDFDISQEDFNKIIEMNCYYCGSPPNNVYNNYTYSGIDRINNKEGYFATNCVPCCFYCNFGKSDKSLEEFEDWITKVYKYSIEPKTK